MKVYYQTNFKLLAKVNNFKAASKYLSEDNMTEYLLEDKSIPKTTKEKIKSIKWVLQANDHGYIILECNDKLDKSELSLISKFVSWQNENGLGEGFEQRDFACDKNDNMASFDWKTNKYIFKQMYNYKPN